MSKKLQTEISNIIKESSSVVDHIKNLSLTESIRELIEDRKRWMDYALDKEASSERYRHAITNVLSIPEREWTKKKVSTILKKALGEL